MIRTAEGIIVELGICNARATAFTKYRDKPCFSMDDISRIVFEARKEIIKECAKKVKHGTDTKSITSLISKLK